MGEADPLSPILAAMQEADKPILKILERMNAADREWIERVTATLR